jgi:hypothetical protein
MKKLFFSILGLLLLPSTANATIAHGLSWNLSVKDEKSGIVHQIPVVVSGQIIPFTNGKCKQLGIFAKGSVAGMGIVCQFANGNSMVITTCQTNRVDSDLEVLHVIVDKNEFAIAGSCITED